MKTIIALTLIPNLAFGSNFIDQPQIGNLTHLNARFLNNAIGRFLTRDPMHQYHAEYNYGDGRVIAGSDPSGLAKDSIVGGAMSLIDNMIEGASGSEHEINTNEHKTAKREKVRRVSSRKRSMRIKNKGASYTSGDIVATDKGCVQSDCLDDFYKTFSNELKDGGYESPIRKVESDDTSPESGDEYTGLVSNKKTAKKIASSSDDDFVLEKPKKRRPRRKRPVSDFDVADGVNPVVDDGLRPWTRADDIKWSLVGLVVGLVIVVPIVAVIMIFA